MNVKYAKGVRQNRVVGDPPPFILLRGNGVLVNWTNRNLIVAVLNINCKYNKLKLEMSRDSIMFTFLMGDK